MTDYDIPAWNPVIAGLRARGIAAVIDTSTPGWWWISALTENPDEMVMIGSHKTGAADRYEASIDLEAGPQDHYLVYRQITGDPAIHVTEDVYTDTTDLDELAAAIRTVVTAPMKKL